MKRIQLADGGLQCDNPNKTLTSPETGNGSNLLLVDVWQTSDRPFRDYPIGTKAQAQGGGYWIKNERGWKWCTGATFPAPGGDWNGMVSLPIAAKCPITPEQIDLTTNASKESENPAFLVGADKRRRHKWKRVGHTYDHTWECQKCGCIKDAVRMFSTEYRLNGETFETAPNCPAALL